MARSGDALGYYYEEGYIDEGYIRYEPYIEEGYIEATYFQEEGITQEATVSLTASFTQTAVNTRVRSATVDIDSLFTPTISIRATRPGDVDMFVDTAFSSVAVRTRDNTVTLNNIVNLSLQGIRSRQVSSNLTTSFDLTAAPVIQKVSGADLSAQFDFTAQGIPVAPGQSNLSAAFTVQANAIKYIRDLNYPNNRPKTITTTDGWTFDTVEQKHGSACLKATDTTGQKYIQVNGDFQVVTNTSQSYTLEFWYKVDTLINEAADAILFNYTSGTQVYQLNITNISNGTADLDFRTPAGATLADVTNISFAQDVWHHIGFRTKPYVNISTPNLEVWIDNNRIYNVASLGAETASDDDTAFLRIYAYDENGPTTYVDSLSVRRAANSSAYIAFQGKTSEPTNDEDSTLVLALFNGNLDDSVSRTRLFAANLNSVASLTLLAGAAFDATADLNSTVTTDIQASKTVDFQVDTASAFDLTATGEFVPLEFASDLAVVATVSADVGIIKSANSALNATFSQTASFGVFRRAAISLNAQVAQNAVISRFAGADTSLVAETNLNSQITRIQQLAADLGALFTPTVTALAQMTGEVLCINNFTQTADIERIRSASADFNAFNSQISVAVVVASGVIDLASAFTQTIDALKFGGSQAVFNTNTALTANAGTVKQAAASFESTAQQTAIAQTVLEATATQNNTFSQTVVAQTTTSTVLELSAFNTQVAVAVKVASFLADPTTVSVLTASADRTRDLESALSTTATLTADVGVIKQGTTVFDSLFAQTATAANLAFGSATLASEGGFVLAARISASGSIDLDSAFSAVDWRADKTTGFASDVVAEVQLACTATVTRTTLVDLDSQFVQTAQGGTTVGIIADLNTVAAITIGGNLIIVDRVIYSIPRETRTHAVLGETRNHTIHQETRAYTLEGER